MCASVERKMGKTNEEIAKRRSANVAIKNLRREYNTLETYSHDIVEDMHKLILRKKKQAEESRKAVVASSMDTRITSKITIEIKEYEALLQQLGKLNYHTYNIKNMNKQLTESLGKTRKQTEYFKSEMSSYNEIAKVFKSSEMVSKDNRIFIKALKVK